MDPLVQNLTVPGQDNTDSFTYNPAGQIASRTRSNTGYSFASHINVDTLFGHNGLNQITSVSGSAAPTYDARGNMTSDGAVSFGYDQYNRLTSAGSATFSYDALGRLYQSTGASGTARRQYDGANMIAVYNSAGSLTERYVHSPGMDEPLVMYTGSGTSNRTFLHADARGSIIAHTDYLGQLSAVLTYDEYGNPGPGNTGRYQYTGQTWLADAGLYHYKNRAYNPRLMRFMQADPIGHTGGINLYAYVGGDPVNFTDPWGLFAWDSDCRPDLPEGEPFSCEHETPDGRVRTTTYCCLADSNESTIPGLISGGGGAIGLVGGGGGSGGGNSSVAPIDYVPVQFRPRIGPPPVTMGARPPTSPRILPDFPYPHGWNGATPPPGSTGLVRPSPNANWYNPRQGISYRPDPAHPKPIGPHIDVHIRPGRGPNGQRFPGEAWRWYPNGRWELKGVVMQDGSISYCYGLYCA
ncbi:MAG: RHS repeat-associated core domain-containing protein [Oceanicaulis sp.]